MKSKLDAIGRRLVRQRNKRLIKQITTSFNGMEFKFDNVVDFVLGPGPHHPDDVRKIRCLFNNHFIQTGIAIRIRTEGTPGRGGNLAIYKLQKQVQVEAEEPKTINLEPSMIGESIIRMVEHLRSENEAVKRQNADLQLEVYGLQRRVQILNKKLTGTTASISDIMSQ